MATVDMYTPYPKNLLDAMKRYSLAANLEWPITEKQFEEMMGDPNMPRMAHLTLREEEIIEVRYKVYHTAEEAGKLIHPSVSRTRFCALEARLFVKLRRYAVRYLHIHGKEEEAGERRTEMTTLEEIKEMTEPVWLHWRERMPLMAAEEAGEFIQAVSKLERKLWARDIEGDDSVRTEAEYDHVIEEMGDVLIVIGALANRYSITADEIEKAIRDKLSEERTM